MDDEQTTKNLEKDVSRQSFPTVPNDSTILQPFWVRCGSVWTNLMDRKFMESQLYFVLCCGSIFWFLLILEEVI